MTATYSQRPLSGHSLNWRPKGKGIKGKPWGTPTSEEIAVLLDQVQKAIEKDGALVRSSEAIALLSDCHAMLLRCQAALPAAVDYSPLPHAFAEEGA